MIRFTKIITIIVISIIMIVLDGCYSFKGGSVPVHLKTIAIPLYNDQSGFGEANLREIFTNKTIDLFIKDNSMQLADERTSDSILECAILAIRDEPLVIEAGEAVTKRKITITVRAVFKDMKLKKNIFDRQLSNWGEYDPTGSPAARQQAITAAIDKVAEDILLETVSGW